ncbi:TIGR00730 family Rossman fold protein [Alteriqipengyuania sp.]|uniref:LOG family protein n=1 Tax=Alteriqipengyuania sp. TaxID=2800692 RepID=UPI0035163A50
MNRIAIYCGAATPADPRYIELAHEVGGELARRGIGVVYGGGRLGLMGALADGALSAGGEVIGVIPHAMVEREFANHDCTQLITVDTMHERKARFTDLADGFVTLPGGLGTMDELFEALSWAQIGYHENPVGLLNAFGFYDDLIGFVNRMADTGFVRASHREILQIADSLPELLGKLASYVPNTPIYRMSADEL